MHNISVDEVIRRIENEELIDASIDGAFTVVIEKYVPFICTAIHNGSNLDDQLLKKVNLNKQERWYEEDPFTGEFIESLPIYIIAHDSRYEYDLNRDESNCIYDEAWGKKVWKEPLSPTEIDQSLNKHRNFYKVLDALVKKVQRLYKTCIIYDIHSYNHRRKNEENNYPVFNIGTERVNTKKYGTYITHFMNELHKIEFAHFETTVAENDVFYGRGYLAKHTFNFTKNALVVPLEIKKIYCNENTGDTYPEIIYILKEGLKNAIIANSMAFINGETNKKVSNKSDLLSNIEDPILKKVDSKLYDLLKNFETLTYVNPKNLERSKKQFFSSKYRIEPKFTYIPLKVDVYELKQKLYALPVSEIYDVSVQRLYKDIINEYVTTLDMLASRGTEQFLFNSLKLYGKPDDKDVKNANYIIQSYGRDLSDENLLTTEQVLEYFRNEIKRWGTGGKVILGKNMAARAMVNSVKKSLVINDKAKFNMNDLELLSNHELGVHMLTTMNALSQPLKFLILGTPTNVETQEGLAILAESLTGKLHIGRLKDLAYRVIAVDLMVKGHSFRDIFERLVDEYDFTQDKAFNLTARVMRGGGFTKDFVYLRGFIKVYNYYLKGHSIDELLIGKTSLEYAPLLKELIDRGYLKDCLHVNPIYNQGEVGNKIIEYILKSTL